MIFDRTRYYLIASGAALLIFLGMWFGIPRITAEDRVKEQLDLLAQEPWTRVEVQQVQPVGSGSEMLVQGRRLDTGMPVTVDFKAGNPYTSEATIQSLRARPLDGTVADILMLPRSITREPYRSTFQPTATHVGVAVFAGLPDAADTASSADTKVPGPSSTPAHSDASTATDG